MSAMKNEALMGVQMVIAMKGHPGTGKSTLAHALASSLRIPLIDKDDVRDSTFPLQSYLSPPPATATANPTASKLLNDLSYQVIWQIALTQLRLGLSVIVDSPLSRRSHLDRLLHLASLTGACLVIVECKPSDEVEWRRRLERRGSGAADDHRQEGAAGAWHKPSEWQDLERLVEGYGGCTDYDVGHVPKLVVDTTAPVGLDQIASTVKAFLASHSHLHTP
uniref:P-loop containing nucleoside triphosphate hydrolase protein n=1 Tax=Rhizophora mucronata TaxID=61149 RepID=A0A2P2QYA3_RHIMU